MSSGCLYPFPTGNPNDIKLRDVQSAAVTRFVARCGSQRGFLVWHTMGSGKTAIGLAFMANFSAKFKRCIIVPDGLDTAWKKDMKDFFLSREFVCSVVFITYSALETMSGKDLGVMKDAIVVCDEAHKLVATLRGPARANVRAALKSCHRILLLTGTPVQSGWGDLGVLVNVVDGTPFIPGTTDRFIAQFPKRDTLDPATRTRWRLFDEAFSWIYNYKTVAGTVSAAIGMATLAPAAVIAIGAASLMYAAGLAYNQLIFDNQLRELADIDIDKVVKKVEPYVSFFDYNTLKETDETLKDYPVILDGEEQRVSVSPSGFQLELWRASQAPSNRQTNADLIMFADVDIDETSEGSAFERDWTDASVRETFDVNAYRLRMRVLGNLSTMCSMYTTVREPVTTERPTTRDFNTTLAKIGNRAYKAVALKDAVSVARQQRADASMEMQTYLSTMQFQAAFKCEKFDKAVEFCLAARTQHNYLPVVYSNVDKYGFQLFSAYLTSLGLAHIVIHPQDDPIVRGRLVGVANLPHRLFTMDSETKKISPVTPTTKSDHAILCSASMQRDCLDHAAELTELFKALTTATAGENAARAAMNIHANGSPAFESALDAYLKASTARSEAAVQHEKKKVELSFDQWFDHVSTTPSPVHEKRVFRPGTFPKEADYGAMCQLRANSWNQADVFARLKFLYANSTQVPIPTTEEGKDRNWHSVNDETPFCVLLHPDIREGIGFDLAPSMICLEVPDGVGNRDQIYARVLRSVNAQKRMCAFVDETFMCSARGMKNGAERKKILSEETKNGGFSSRSWRVTKRVYQLMLGTAPQMMLIPSWVRFFSPDMPRYLPIPDLTDLLWKPSDGGVVVRTARIKTVAALNARHNAEHEASSESMKAKQFTEIKQLVDSGSISDAWIFTGQIRWEYFKSLYRLPADWSPEKVQEEMTPVTWASRATDPMGAICDVVCCLLNFYRYPRTVSPCKAAAWFWRFTSGKYWNFFEEYNKRVKNGEMVMSYERFLKDVRNFDPMTGDEATVNMNLKSSELLLQMRDAFTKGSQDAKAVCKMTNNPTDGCTIWKPDTEEAQKTAASNKDSCVYQQDAHKSDVVLDFGLAGGRARKSKSKSKSSPVRSNVSQRAISRQASPSRTRSKSKSRSKRHASSRSRSRSPCRKKAASPKRKK
jgi:hypothetical protein